jgi:hypothetical protein
LARQAVQQRRQHPPHADQDRAEERRPGECDDPELGGQPMLSGRVAEGGQADHHQDDDDVLDDQEPDGDAAVEVLEAVLDGLEEDDPQHGYFQMRIIELTGS